MSVLKSGVRWLMRTLPASRWIDRGIATAMFVHDNGRLPRVPPVRYYDLLYWIKTRELDDPLRIRVSDKLIAKEHIREVLGHDPCPRTLTVFRRPQDVTADAIPLPCVVKPSHMSGRYLYLRAKPDPRQIAQIRGWLGENYYFRHSREWNYLHLSPAVLCEEPVAPPETLTDAKVFCLNGEPKLILVIFNRFLNDRRVAAFDPEWRMLSHYRGPPPARIADRPERLEEMLDLARRLSAPFSLIRVDCYLRPDRILVGELTNLPFGGRHGSLPDEEALLERALGGPPMSRYLTGSAGARV